MKRSKIALVLATMTLSLGLIAGCSTEKKASSENSKTVQTTESSKPSKEELEKEQAEKEQAVLATLQDAYSGEGTVSFDAKEKFYIVRPNEKVENLIKKIVYQTINGTVSQEIIDEKNDEMETNSAYIQKKLGSDDYSLNYLLSSKEGDFGVFMKAQNGKVIYSYLDDVKNGK